MNEALTPTPLDSRFAALMVKLNGQPDRTLEHAARSVSAWRAAGHICVPLTELGGRAMEDELRATAVVGTPGEFKPLILDERGRLYLHRYWAYETELARAIQQRLGRSMEFEEELLLSGLRRFEQAESQRTAARMAVEKNLCVITGGPGTGKTRTVVVVLALLIEQFAARNQKGRIALTAPTGKAAARMKESVQQMAASSAFANVRDQLPQDATTLHRLLGVIPNSPRFRHDAQHPLAKDVVIVDEASMVDLALMAKLFAAVPSHARVILLGDKDQLASVEAGNVLGDICAGGRDALIGEHIVELRENFRFAPESGIHRLSRDVNGGDAHAALALLESAPLSDLVASRLPALAALARSLAPRVIGGYGKYLAQNDPALALADFSQFRILCAFRRGPFGVENMNRLAEEALTEAGLIDPESTHYRGRPILILTNDYNLKLYNGDVGLILPDAEAGGELRAFFQDASGGIRRFLPSRLPAHETVFAMTVHKSQGSEFEQVLFVLSDQDSPLLTRELVYTGITRASERVELWYRGEILREAIARRVERSSGLRDALWSP